MHLIVGRFFLSNWLTHLTQIVSPKVIRKPLLFVQRTSFLPERRWNSLTFNVVELKFWVWWVRKFYIKKTFPSPHQRIIGFSFYGDTNSDHSKRKGYFNGIQANLELIPKFYPGWTIRLYLDLDKTNELLNEICDLACNDSNIDLCDVKNLPGTPFIDAAEIFPRNWRFFPTLDPQVYIRFLIL